MIPLHDNNPTERFPIVTILLIAINVAVFFLWQLGSVGLEQSIRMAAFVPAKLVTSSLVGQVDNLFASMFMHGSIMHLVGNMWFLWLFGNNVEDRTGKIRFLIFYLLSGIAATMAYAAFNMHSRIPLVGASGAISGVLGAYLIMFPGTRILTLIPLGFFTRTAYVPAWIFLLIWIGFQFLSQVTIRGEQGGGIAFLAHIAGFIAGIVLIFFFRKRTRTRRMRVSSVEY
jgi:membrane associated rhomboid family serine protease